MYGYNNTNNAKNQDLDFVPLSDCYKGKNGETKERPWKEKKMANELLALAYDDVDTAKAARLRECGKFLTYRVYADGTKHLDRMSSCRVRLCPICTWRRSLVNFANNIAICRYVEQQQPRGWLLCTFTLKRCSADQLNGQIDRILYAYKKLMLNTRVKKAVKGSYRGVEITHDVEEYITPETMRRRGKSLKKQGLHVGDLNPTFDSYHVHIHAIFSVNISYFKNNVYLNADDWTAAWQQAADVDYTPIVNVKRIKPDATGSIAGAVGEVSKYATKENDIIVPHDWDLTVETVKVLDKALANRRFVSYGGELLKAKRALSLQDADKADLTHIGTDEPDSGETYKTVTYWWYSGYRQYGTRKEG